MLQFAHPSVEGRFGDDLADYKETLLFLETDVLPGADPQPLANRFGDGHLSFGPYPGGNHDAPLCKDYFPYQQGKE
jgi:hypothetical protein